MPFGMEILSADMLKLLREPTFREAIQRAMDTGERTVTIVIEREPRTITLRRLD